MNGSTLETDESFLTTAPLIVATTIEVPHSAAQVWSALTDDRMGAWMAIVDRAAWHGPSPRQRGARRTVRVARFLTLEEEFFIWEEQRRIGFRAIDIRPRLATRWAEQCTLETLPDGGTSIEYVTAVDAALLRSIPIPDFLLRVASKVAGRALKGIVTVLPPPERGDAGSQVPRTRPVDPAGLIAVRKTNGPT